MRIYISPHTPSIVKDAITTLSRENDDIPFEEILARLPSTPFSLLHKHTPDPSRGAVDWISNQFDERRLETLQIVPVPHSEPWETVGMLSDMFKPKMILGIFPAFLQIELRFHGAIRSLGMPVCTVVDKQIGAGVALIEELRIGGIVLTQSLLASCMEEVRRANTAEPLYYQAITGLEEKNILSVDSSAASRCRVFNEVHLIPGIIGFFQCPHLAEKGTDIFHPSDRFVWEFDETSAQVTDVRAAPLFSRTPLPRGVEVRDSRCPCGRTIELSLT